MLFGIVMLLWRDPDAWQNLPIQKLPFGELVGYVLALAQIAGGLAVLIPATARRGAIALCAVYGIFTLATIPSIVAAPGSYGPYVSFFELLSLVCGALPLLGGVPDRVTRIGMGLCAVSFATAQAVYFKFTASLVPPWIPPNPSFWVVLTTIAFGLAAIATLINVKARLALRLMGAMTAAFGLLVWVPLLIAHPGSHGNWSEFALNFAITGAAWTVAELRA